MLREALAFPRNRDGALRDLLLGGALVLSSVLVVPGLLVWGYLLRVMDAGARGRDTPPPLHDFGRMVVDGLRATVVVFVWGVLPLVVVTIASGAWSLRVLPVTGTMTSPYLDPARMTPGLAGMVAAVAVPLVLVALVCWLHLPAALAAVGTQGRLRAGFQPGALWAVVNTRQYVVGIVLTAVVATRGSLVATVLTPLLVGLVVSFYVQVVVAYMVGRAVGGAAVTAIRPA
jgi:hypothetical protein